MTIWHKQTNAKPFANNFWFSFYCHRGHQLIPELSKPYTSYCFLCLIFLPTEYDTRDDQWKCRDARSVLQKRKMDSRGPIHFGEELHNIRHQDSSKKLLHKSSAHSSGLLASACLWASSSRLVPCSRSASCRCSTAALTPSPRKASFSTYAMHSAKLCRAQNMRSLYSCRVQNHAWCNIMNNAKLCRV